MILKLEIKSILFLSTLVFLVSCNRNENKVFDLSSYNDFTNSKDSILRSNKFDTQNVLTNYYIDSTLINKILTTKLDSNFVERYFYLLDSGKYSIFHNVTDLKGLIKNNFSFYILDTLINNDSINANVIFEKFQYQGFEPYYGIKLLIKTKFGYNILTLAEDYNQLNHARYGWTILMKNMQILSKKTELYWNDLPHARLFYTDWASNEASDVQIININLIRPLILKKYHFKVKYIGRNYSFINYDRNIITK